MVSKEYGFTEVKKNITKQATKILHDIASAYHRGALDDPQHAATFCQLLACVCEGKVEGSFDEVSGEIKWSLTNDYSKELEKFQESLLAAAMSTGKIVKGPW